MSNKNSMTIDMNEVARKRKGKASGHMPEVSRGNGQHVPKQYKKKFKNSWKKEARKYY